MKLFLIVLLLALLPTTAPCTRGLVRINADVVGLNYIGVFVVKNIVLPTIYVDVTGKVSSEDKTAILDGVNGENAQISIAGKSNTYYSLSFDEHTTLTKGKESVILHVYIKEGSKTHRTLNGQGSDIANIVGEAEFPGNLSEGNYNNFGKPLTITASYDE